MVNYHTELFLPLLINANKLSLLIIPIVYIRKYIEYDLYDYKNENASKSYIDEVLNDSFFYGLLISIGIHVEFFDSSTKSVVASAIILSTLSGVYLALSRYVFNDAPMKYMLSKIATFFTGIYDYLSNSLINLFKSQDAPPVKRRKRRTRAEILSEKNSHAHNPEPEPKPEREDGKLEALAKAMADERLKDMLMKISKESAINPIHALVDPINNSFDHPNEVTSHISKKISENSQYETSHYCGSNSNNDTPNDLENSKKEDKEIPLKEIEQNTIDYNSSVFIDSSIGDPIDSTQNFASESTFWDLHDNGKNNSGDTSNNPIDDTTNDPIS